MFYREFLDNFQNFPLGINKVFLFYCIIVTLAVKPAVLWHGWHLQLLLPPGMWQYHIWASSGFVCAVKVQIWFTVPCVDKKPAICYIRHSLTSLCHCEEHGSAWDYEQPWKMSGVSLRGNDSCLRRPCGHLLHGQKECFFSRRRWVFLITNAVLCMSAFYVDNNQTCCFTPR